MSSREVFYSIADGAYWVFENTLVVMGDYPWIFVMFFGMFAFALWMVLQVRYNKAAENDPNQIK
jgi:uncharacterized membrane protein